MLALHPRTLQRKLAQEGASFDAIKDDIRKELSSQYLWQTDISMSQLTDILEFSEQPTLSRATKRWFELPPKQFRQQKGKLKPLISNKLNK